METERLHIRTTGLAEAPQVADYFARNREFLAPFEPIRKESYFKPARWKRLDPRRWFLFLKEEPERVVGTIHLSRLSPSPFLAGQLGFSLDQELQGRGLMREALERIIEHAFQELGLHRLMANHLPDNVRSEKLLERLGFEREGYARDYLRIQGRWRDHVLRSRVQREPKPLGIPEEGATEINLYQKHLREVPAEVWCHTRLRRLILAENLLVELPAEIGNLTGLNMLDLGHNYLRRVPPELGQLKGLDGFLYLHDNRLTELPESLVQLKALRYLNLGENRFTELPPAVAGLESLVELRAAHNQLTELPDWLGELSRLEELHLRGNSIARLPEALSRLQELTHLDLRGNPIVELPEWLSRLSSLRKLDLRWTPVEFGPVLERLTARGCRVYL